MCGIFGVMSQNILIQKAQESQKLIAHRGPDSTTEYLNQEQGVYLAFHRLSIQDLSINADQPMFSHCKRIIVMLNGEIYNFKILRSKLINSGYIFRSNSDTEVILAGYQIWGLKKLLNEIDGMFAIVIIDFNKNILILIRDNFGIKPMYFKLDNGNLIFSSEIKPILNYQGSNELDMINLRNEVLFTSLPHNNGTNFKNIFKVKQGEYLVYQLDEKKVSSEKYFDLKDLIDPKEYNINSQLSRRKIAKKVESVLTDAVQSSLITDSRVGVLLSGGLDSSIIARLASKLEDNSVECFSLNNSDSYKQLNIFEKKFSNTSYRIRLDEFETFKNLGTLIFNLEHINKTESWILGRVCELAKTRGVKSLLSGDGSDELFAGYNEHVESYLNSKLKRNFLTSKLLKFLYNNGFDNFSNLYSSLKPSSSALLKVPLDAFIHSGEGILATNEAENVYGFEPNPTIRAGNGLLFTEISFWIERFLLRADKYSSNSSTEIRLPYLRKDVVKLALNIPFNKKIKFKLNFNNRRIFQTKVILRLVARNLDIPKNIVNQRKVGTNFTNDQIINKLFDSWNFTELNRYFNWNIINSPELSYLYPSRLKVSLISGDIFIRIFNNCESPYAINEKIKNILE